MIRLALFLAALFLPVAAQAQITCPAPVGPGRVVGDANMTLSNSFSYYETGATITAPRTWTLPPASTVNKYCMMIFSDQFGGITPANPVTIAAGSAQSGKQDLIDGNPSVSLNSQYAVIFLQSDGSSKWVVANATTSLFNGAQSVPNLAVLQASPTRFYPNGVWRLSYGNGNNAPPLWFAPQTGTCNTHGLTNDTGSCVNTVDGNSFAAVFAPPGFDIRQWGAIGNGATDTTTKTVNSTAIQQAINYAVNIVGGGTVYVPGTASPYVINATLAVSPPTGASYLGKIQILGDGPSRSEISCPGCALDVLQYNGLLTTSSDIESHFEVAEIRLQSDGGSCVSNGIKLTNAAWALFRHVSVEGFGTGIATIDSDQLGFYDLIVRNNFQGIFFNDASLATGPNNLTFSNVFVGTNTYGGVSLSSANAMMWSGGSVQYNGVRQLANGTISTGSATITMSSTNPGCIPLGATVYDLTTNQILGTFSSWSGNTLTMQALSLHNGSGSSDLISLGYGFALSNDNHGNPGSALGYATAKFAGMIFEGNAGAGDLITTQSTANSMLNVSVDNVAFERTGTTGFGLNNILIAGTQQVTYNIANTNFTSGAYTASSGRPTVVFSNSGTGSVVNMDDVSNFWWNSSEKPAAAAFSTITTPTSWTPIDNSGASLSLTINSATYTKRNHLYTVTYDITYPVTANGSQMSIGGYPGTATAAATHNPDNFLIQDSSGGVFYGGYMSPNTATSTASKITSVATVKNSDLSAHTIAATVTYQAQ